MLKRISSLVLIFLILISITFFGCARTERKPIDNLSPKADTVREPGSVPTPVTEIPKDILQASDYYAQAIGTQNWDRAKAMSSERNLDQLDRVVKLQIEELSKDLKVDPLIFDNINFEAALLVKENYDDMIVTESLAFKDRQLDEKIYLKFHIVRDKDKFIVDTTEILRRKGDPRHP